MNTDKIALFKKHIHGTVATTGETAYTDASTMLFNTISPSIVVRPSSAEDIAATIDFAKQNNLPLAVRSGGHGSAALRIPEGAVLIDMRSMAKIEVIDIKEGTVRIETGALWHQVASELEKHKLAISSGDTRTVGVGGLTAGGGLGWMIRKYGPAVDNIISAEVVTADGSIVEVSESQNADLFWAIRGGGGNFGIITAFTFKAQRIEGIIVGKISYPLQNIPIIMKAWRDAMRKAPVELSTMLMTFPGMGDAPASIFIHGCYAGTNMDAAREAYEPLLHLNGEATSSELTPGPYASILEDGMPLKDIRVIAHADYIKEFSNEVIDTICKQFKEETPILQIRHLQGAMSKLRPDATAFSHRDCEVLVVHPTFVAPHATDDEVEKATKTWRVIHSLGSGMYLNLLTENNGNEVAEGFSPEALKRLHILKAKYDPENIFSGNYNITPSA